MDQGVSAILGAVAGGLATFGGVAYGQWRLGIRDRTKAKEHAAEAALISARIVQSELAWAKTRVRQALKGDTYWSADYRLAEDAWLAYREQLAVALDSSDDWSTVRDGFRWLHALELQASQRRTKEQPRPEVSDKGREQHPDKLLVVVDQADAELVAARRLVVPVQLLDEPAGGAEGDRLEAKLAHLRHHPDAT